MEDQTILIDTSILIDYYRKTDKQNSAWVQLIRSGYSFAISTVTKYEICSGAKPDQLQFWESIFQQLTVVPFDETCVDTAVNINANLKRKRKQIDLADLFIAATAVSNALELATLNKKHFDRIDDLSII